MKNVAYQHDTVPRQYLSHEFVFRGNGEVYFRIWAVNMALILATAGIYSAWASVRSRGYFHACTQLNGVSFRYLGSPLPILKGRLVLAVLVFVYVLGVQYSLETAVLALALVALVLPWLLMQNAVYQANHTAYGNIRFAFQRWYQDFYAAYLGWPLLALFTAGVLCPVMWQRQDQCRIANLRYGDGEFNTSATVGDYYGIFFRLLALGAALGFGVVMITALLKSILPVPALWFWAQLAAFALIALVLRVYYLVCHRNLLWSSVELEDHVLECNLKFIPMLKIYLVNLVYIICTLGLYTPWAMMRIAAYRARHMSLYTRRPLEVFVAARHQAEPATEDLEDYFNWPLGV